MGTLYRRNGFYTVQTIFSIALHLKLPLTGNFVHFHFLKKSHSVWFISLLNYGDTENVLINHILLVIICNMAAVASSRWMLHTGGGWGDPPLLCKALWVPRKALYTCNKILLFLIPMSYPCHYTNLCPHKPHTHTHTHTHARTHARTHTHAHTQSLSLSL